jgi:hypothetical protein
MKRVLIFCVLLLAFMIGCQSTPQDTPPLSPPVITEPVVKHTITVTNSMDTWYIVKIMKDATWVDDHIVIQPQEIKTLSLASGTYKVCLQKELSGKETCINKVVTGEDEWNIRRK